MNGCKAQEERERERWLARTLASGRRLEWDWSFWRRPDQGAPDGPWRVWLRPEGFSLVLIDKDGQVKQRKPVIWDTREISRAIDKFPSRRTETGRAGFAQ